MLHFKQKTGVSCGAAAYRSIISQFELISEKQAVDEVGTTKKGTCTFNVLNAFKKRKLDANIVHLNISFRIYSRWLELNSKNRLLYLDCNFVSGKTKNSNRFHALAVSNGFIFDPSEEKPCPVDCFFDCFHKDLIIRSMILIDLS